MGNSSTDLGQVYVPDAYSAQEAKEGKIPHDLQFGTPSFMCIRCGRSGYGTLYHKEYTVWRYPELY